MQIQIVSGSIVGMSMNYPEHNIHFSAALNSLSHLLYCIQYSRSVPCIIRTSELPVRDLVLLHQECDWVETPADVSNHS